MFGFALADYLIFGFIIIGATYVCIRGFADEIAGKAGFFIGFLLAMMFTVRIAYSIREVFNLDELLSALIAFCVLFVIGFVACLIVGRMSERALEGVGLSSLNHLLGFLLGIVEAFVIVCVVLTILGYQTVFNVNDALNNSFYYNKIFLPFRNWVMMSLPGVNA